MRYYMGIDGGGSGMRVVIINSEHEIITRVEAESANPSGIGLDEAAKRIQAAMNDALRQASLHPNAIAAVGIGIAGASEEHSKGWLQSTTKGVLSAAKVVPSSDVEVALVGAHGGRIGALLIAGTGSVIAGIDGEDQLVRYGGWGYVFGDEGSGYWIGRQALTTVAQAYDHQGPSTILVTRIPSHLGLKGARELIKWVYRGEKVPVQDIAALVPVVLMAAGDGDGVARQIVEMAAHYLAHLSTTLLHRTGLTPAYLKFAGSLISTENRVSNRLCELLELEKIPQAQNEPVIGAALMALNADQPGS
ncbi:MAG: hypothetical protein KC708_04345 [Anaerolineae bacterium]|nr:hypothetical protein [Anaerolineae bacterium]